MRSQCLPAGNIHHSSSHCIVKVIGQPILISCRKVCLKKAHVKMKVQGSDSSRGKKRSHNWLQESNPVIGSKSKRATQSLRGSW